MKFEKISYEMDLNSRQKENYNFQKVSAFLADYGFLTIRLSDDWNGADFLALHKDGATVKVQLKSRLTFDAKYLSAELWICYRKESDWYFYPHDDFLNEVCKINDIKQTQSWLNSGSYSFPRLGKKIQKIMNKYRLTADGFVQQDSDFLANE